MTPQNKTERDAFRWPVSASASINTPASGLWEAIAEPGCLRDAHPFVASNPVQQWPGADSRDEVHYLNGVCYRREFREWHEGVGYDLEIFHEARLLAWVSWRVTAEDDATSALHITVYPAGLQHLPVAVRWLPHLAVVRPKLRAYLESVVHGFEWSITRCEPVPDNQFGEHPWFS